MALTQIFVDKKLHDIVPIKARQITPDLYLHLKHNLIQQVEKKCLSYCYVSKVREITKYDEGEMRQEDFTGDVQFKVSYNARVCIPTIGCNIVCKLDKIIKLVILVVNGPLICTVRVSETEIDQNVFTIQNSDKIIYKKTGKELAPGDHVKITIINQKIFQGQDYIAIFAKMYDIANEQEINTYMHKDVGVDDETNDNNNTIYEMNEDAGIEEGIIPTASTKRETYVQDV